MCVIFFCTKKDRKNVREVTKVDTIKIVMRDTVLIREPVYLSKTIVDTIIIHNVKDNKVELPIEQIHYRDSLYEAWVSGYKPSLDSISVFPREYTNIIYRNKTNYIYEKRNDVYIRAGMFMIGNEAEPYLGAMIKFKKDFSIGADVGYFNGDFFYGMNIGIVINK